MKTLIPQIIKRLMDKGHLSCLWRLIYRYMFACLEKVGEYGTFGSATDEILPGHEFIIYKRGIHLHFNVS